MTTKPSKKPKLPKVWVVLDDVGYPYDRRPLTKKSELPWPRGWVECQYAPVQKPKVCGVVHAGTDLGPYGTTDCGHEVSWYGDFKFCPYCGGKISHDQHPYHDPAG